MIHNLQNMIRFLNSKNIDAWVSGGTARDIYLDKEFTNLDISVKTNLETIQEIFKDRIISLNTQNNSVEVHYLDNKYIIYPYTKVTLMNTYPTKQLTTSLEDDAQSRDFTINSLYFNPVTGAWVDYFGGKIDADNKKIKFIGDWQTKILESRIRLLRAPILLGMLGSGWEIDYHTKVALKEYHLKLAGLSRPKLKLEMSKIFTRCEKPSIVFDELKDTNLLNILCPELKTCIGVDQGAKTTHYLDLYQHIMFAMDSVPQHGSNSELVRVAALLHDIAKPHTETWTDRGRHFFNHEVIGKNLAEQILYRWGYPANFRKKVGKLIVHHLFNISSTDTKTVLRKFIFRVGPELVHSVLDLRVADINGVPQSKSLYKINNLRRKINKELSTISPENAKLAITDEELEIMVKPHTEPGLLKDTIQKSKKFLLSKIFLGRLHNKKTNLKKALNNILMIHCPLDKPHLMSTWEHIQTGTSDTFQNGKLKCGVYCGFNCDKKLSK